MSLVAVQPSSCRASDGIGPRLGDVAGAAVHDPVGHLAARGLLEGGDHLEHAGPVAGAEVACDHAGADPKPVERAQVAEGQIDHVDVVADPGAVAGGPVAAVDVELGQAAHRHLGDVGHQIVGNAAGILADPAAGVGADRVEIAEQRQPPARARPGRDRSGCPR